MLKWIGKLSIPYCFFNFQTQLKKATVVLFPEQRPCLALLSSPLLTLWHLLSALCFPFPSKTNYEHFLQTSRSRLQVCYQKLYANSVHHDVTNLLPARILAALISLSQKYKPKAESVHVGRPYEAVKTSKKSLGTFNYHPIEVSKPDVLVLRSIASLSMHHH